jgi:hypothetical protein
VGDRYNAGRVARLLSDCIPEDREWGDHGDITFTIPEHLAWEINELAEEQDYTWACFAPSLVSKPNDLAEASSDASNGVRGTGSAPGHWSSSDTEGLRGDGESGSVAECESQEFGGFS